MRIVEYMLLFLIYIYRTSSYLQILQHVLTYTSFTYIYIYILLVDNSPIASPRCEVTRSAIQFHVHTDKRDSSSPHTKYLKIDWSVRTTYIYMNV